MWTGVIWSGCFFFVNSHFSYNSTRVTTCICGSYLYNKSTCGVNRVQLVWLVVSQRDT